MTAETLTPSTPVAPLPTRVDFARDARSHRPLSVLAVAMAATALLGIAGLVLDDRLVTGLPLWAKPVKFALSVAIYAVTFGWLIAQLRRWRRVAWWAGTVAAFALGIEMVIIVAQALRGTTSHFNYTTPLDATLFSIMAGSIGVLWAATLVVSVVLFANPDPDPARALAVRAGAVIALIGMGLGFLMTAPTDQQLADDTGIIGAHTVGLSDGGPGLPILGWSTVAGDLRVPHFIGMHALQLIPLLLIALELLARRVPALRPAGVRARLVALAAAGYAALVGIVTWQALRGQSIVRPDALTLAALGAVALAVLGGAAVVLARAARAQNRRPVAVTS